MNGNARNTFTLGHSPDADDAFMFYAMAARKIDLRGYRFEHRLEDIQTLNERATRGELDISAISIHAYAYVGDKYALLPCGASMGDGYGPLLVAPNDIKLNDPRAFLRNKTIAVPGRMTSAFLALQLYLDEFEYIIVPFDKIFEAVKAGQADVGLIIHEGQLTYARAGFQKIMDLGEWWKAETSLPLPLGGNVLRRDLPRQTQHDFAEILRESIQFALTHRAQAVDHALNYAHDMDGKLAARFIGMYVNDYTRDYGARGREAITRFLAEAHRRGHLARQPVIEFVD